MESTSSERPHYDSADSTSTSLLLRAIEQDPIAWERIVKLYGPLVYRWCRKSLQPNDASDLTQEVFKSVSLNLMKFNYAGDKSSFRGWLRTITRNKITDEFRRANRQAVAPGGSDAHAQLQQLEDQFSDDHDDYEVEDERLGLLRRAIQLVRSDFSERVWDVFLATAIEGRTNAEVAEEIGKSTGYVRNIAYRVRNRLHEELGHFGDFQF